MRITMRGHYVMQVLVEIAERQRSGSATSLVQICEDTSLSRGYLERLLRPLVKSGALRSFRGINGGYMLARDPENYSILEILEMTEGLALNPFLYKGSDTVEEDSRHKLFSLWEGLEEHVYHYLQGFTLSDFVKEEGDAPLPEQ